MFDLKKFFVKKGPKRPNVLLKFDDFSRKTRRWNDIFRLLKKYNIKASFGVIGLGMENLSPRNINWIKKLNKSGRVQFFNHGYTHSWKKDFEFENKSIEEQSLTLKKTQKVFFDKTGIIMTCFGAPCNKRDKNTYNALLDNPDIKTWFVENSNIKYKLGICILPLNSVLKEPSENTASLEFHGDDFFSVSLQRTKEEYDKNMDEQILVLQGHPMLWSDESLKQFVLTVKYLKRLGCKFILPDDILNNEDKYD